MVSIFKGFLDVTASSQSSRRRRSSHCSHSFLWIVFAFCRVSIFIWPYIYPPWGEKIKGEQTTSKGGAQDDVVPCFPQAAAIFDGENLVFSIFHDHSEYSLLESGPFHVVFTLSCAEAQWNWSFSYHLYFVMCTKPCSYFQNCCPHSSLESNQNPKINGSQMKMNVLYSFGDNSRDNLCCCSGLSKSPTF